MTIKNNYLKKIKHSLFFYLFKIFIALIRALPWSIAYSLSNCIAFMLNRVLKIRKHIILKNITLCFPNLSTQASKQLVKKVYQVYSDYYIELFKNNSTNQSNYPNILINIKEIEHYLFNNQSVICWSGHYGNIELFHSVFNHQAIAAYKSLRNPYINQWLFNQRSQYGSQLIQSNKILLSIRNLLRTRNKKTGKSLIFFADQRSQEKESVLVNFFNKKLSFAKSTEKLARRYQIPMFYLSIQRLKRGSYQVSCVELNPDDNQYSSMTQQAVSLLETDIKASPEHYWWFHNRWKNNPQ